MRKLIGGTLIVLGWLAYIGLTGCFGFLIFAGDTKAIWTNYFPGLGAIWVTVGAVLWAGAEWYDEFEG